MPDWKFWFEKCLDSIISQSYENIEVVITDNSDDDEIRRFTERYAMPIKFFKNPKKGICPNTNEAIKRATGSIIKVLYMDDQLASKNALQLIVEAFSADKTRYWLVTACEHTHGKDRFNKIVPKYSDSLKKGVNTIGAPSVLAFRNDNPLLFNENLTWVLDCDLYCRLFNCHGEPIILKDVGVLIGIHAGQATNIIDDETKRKEENYYLTK